MDDILQCLKEIDYPVTVDITEGYPSTKPNFTKPLIVVRELQNVVDSITYTDKEEYSNITIEVEIYSRAQSINGRKMDGNRVCSVLRSLIDNALASKLCLFRIGNPFSQPSVFDETVARYVMTYEVTVDNTYHICYRGLL